MQAGGEIPTGSDDRAMTMLILQFFKDDDPEIEMTLKVRSSHPNNINSSFCYNDTMQKVKLEYIFQFERYRTKALFWSNLKFQRSPKSDQFCPSSVLTIYQFQFGTGSENNVRK